MTIHVVPIEPLDQRYTAQWIDWFGSDFHSYKVESRWYLPKSEPQIRRGQFLDVINTNKFKAEQLALLCEAFDRDEIRSGDVIFFFDLWFPGLEMLFYMRDGLGIDFKIAGILHAGTWDPFDFLTQKGMRTWATPIEKAWFAETDLIFLATNFHKELLKSRTPRNVSVTGLPLYYAGPAEAKENIIVFPHRLAPEKQPELFDKMAAELRTELPDYKFIKTQASPLSKNDYYRLLAKAKVSISFNQQETWGIAMLESLFHNCVPVAPNRLAYPETMPEACLYKNIDEAYSMVLDAALDYEQTWTPIMNAWRNKQIEHHATAITRMVVAMRQKGWQL